MKLFFSISIINLSLIFSPFLWSKNLTENGADFQNFQKTLTREQAENIIYSKLQKDKEIENWYLLTDQFLKMYASPQNKLKDLPEFVLYFGQNPKPNSHFPHPTQNTLPLKGLRVAIDPGHCGGHYALLEERYIDMPIDLEHNITTPLTFYEGNLNVMTAYRLQAKLEALGAKVMLTKSKIGECLCEKPFDQWLKEDFDQAVEKLVALETDPVKQKQDRLYWKTQASRTEIFRSTYNFIDLQNRADKINAFNPHVTVTCHYNLAGEYEKNGKTLGTAVDYTIFFVPGAFKKGMTKDEAYKNASLKDPTSRYEFIRLLVTDDLDQSVKLALIAKKHTEDAFSLPAGDHCDYLKVLCLPASSGIYHRNLTLTRLVHSPILYGEPLCQDNFNNASILGKNPEAIIEKVADVYTSSILDWAQQNQVIDQAFPKSSLK